MSVELGERGAMRVALCVFIVTLAVPFTVAAQTELAVGGGATFSSDMGELGAQAKADAGGRIAAGLWDFSASASVRQLEKIGTPGGCSRSINVGVRHWFGPDLFLAATAGQVHTDATVWTKDVIFVGGQAGFCLRYGETKKHRPYRDEISMSYQQEVRTDAIAPNRTRGWVFAWQHDVHIHQSLFLRPSMTVGTWRYLQSGQWRNGNSASIGLSIVVRPQDK